MTGPRWTASELSRNPPAPIVGCGRWRLQSFEPGQPHVITNLRDGGFPGKIYPVNPKYETVADLPCYPSVSSIGAHVDTVVIAVAGRHVPDIVGEAVECGVALAVDPL